MTPQLPPCLSIHVPPLASFSHGLYFHFFLSSLFFRFPLLYATTNPHILPTLTKTALQSPNFFIQTSKKTPQFFPFAISFFKFNSPETSKALQCCQGEEMKIASVLLRVTEEVRRGNRGIEDVKLALKVVKVRKYELQDEIMGGLYKELKELKSEEELMKRTEEIVDDVLKVHRGAEKAKREKKAEKF